MPSSSNLIGSATRYIAGRNAVQTVYWRSQSPNENGQQKFIKVLKTCNFGKPQQVSRPPNDIRKNLETMDFYTG